MVVGIEIVETFVETVRYSKLAFQGLKRKHFFHSVHHILVTDKTYFSLFRGFKEQSTQVGSGFGTVSGMVGE